jgi:hypothetical protein
LLPQQSGDGPQGGYLRFQDRGEVLRCHRSRGGLENPLTAGALCRGRQTATYRAAGFAQRQSSHGLPPRYRGVRSAPWHGCRPRLTNGCRITSVSRFSIADACRVSASVKRRWARSACRIIEPAARPRDAGQGQPGRIRDRTVRYRPQTCFPSRIPRQEADTAITVFTRAHPRTYAIEPTLC